MTKKATLGPLVSLDPAMAALAARTAAAWRSEQDQDQDAQPPNPDECRCREHYLACSIHRPQRRGQDGRQLVTATTAHTLHAPESRSERARACPPVAGCPDLDPTWPGPDGNPRGPVRCTSFPACRCGEDEEDEDWPPTNTLRAMRLCGLCERPMVDHDDGAWSETPRASPPTDLSVYRTSDVRRAYLPCEKCGSTKDCHHRMSLGGTDIDDPDDVGPEVTAETVTDDQLDRYHNTIMMSDASSATADQVAMTCGLSKNHDIPSRVRMNARAEIAAAINARAKGGR